MNERDFKDSPFYVEYNGTTNYKKNTIAYHPKQDFNKDLREFFKSRFSGMKDAEILEQIVNDYYFRYAHERRYYGKTIVAIIHKKDFASENPPMIPLLVLDRFPKDNENDVLIDEEMIDNYDIMQFIAWIESYNDISADLEKKIVSLIVSDGFEIQKYDTFKTLKNFNEDSLKDFFVLEIPLNNYLDAELNGVYCFEDNDTDSGAVESLHVGVAIVKDSDKHVDATPMPIVYAWNLENDFSININKIAISKVNLDFLHQLCKKYNPLMFSALKFFEIANFGYETKLKENRHKQAKLKDELEMLKQQEQLLLDSINNENSEN